MLDEQTVRHDAQAQGVTHFASGIAIMRNDGKLLVVRRKLSDDFLAGEWELPGGGVDAGETIEQCAARELKEETGLEIEKVTGTFEGFDYSTPKKPKVRQINFKVTVRPGDIELTEHDAYRWIDAADIPSLKTNGVMQQCLYRAFE